MSPDEIKKRTLIEEEIVQRRYVLEPEPTTANGVSYGWLYAVLTLVAIVALGTSK